ncbi:hypothetical protein ACHAPJ_006272 [Fusarium lateritium]
MVGSKAEDSSNGQFTEPSEKREQGTSTSSNTLDMIEQTFKAFGHGTPSSQNCATGTYEQNFTTWGGRKVGRRMDLYLDGRCVRCRTASILMGLLTTYSLRAASEDEPCAVEGCGEPTTLGIDRCRKHLEELFYDDGKLLKAEIDWNALRSTFTASLGMKWSSTPTYNNVVLRRMNEIRAGNRPPSDVVVLDTEFSASSAQLFELAIIDRVHGKTFINTTIKHSERPNHKKSNDPDKVRHGLVEWMSRLTASRVYSKSRASQLDYLNVDEVAGKLREAGISPNTIFLVWHQGYTDLNILRKFLSAGGYDDILPSNDNCFPMLNHFRQKHLKAPLGLRSFPHKLEILFPVLYPRHALVGRNHQALVDCEQLRLVLEAYDFFCKPVKRRGTFWEPGNFTAIPQKAIDDFFGKKDESQTRKRSAAESDAPVAKRLRSNTKNSDTSDECESKTEPIYENETDIGAEYWTDEDEFEDRDHEVYAEGDDGDGEE